MINCFHVLLLMKFQLAPLPHGQDEPHHGKAVQVEPMKPKLKPPGTKRLKLKCDSLTILLQFCFQFQLAPLRHGAPQHRVGRRAGQHHQAHGQAVQVDPITPTLKAPGITRLKLKYDKLLADVDFNFILRGSGLVRLKGRRGLVKLTM